MKKVVYFISFILMAASLCSSSYADNRKYVWTYEYVTMPKGMFEVEYYVTGEQPDVTKAEPNTWKHYVELEYGITNHLDVAVYQRFKQSNKSSGDEFEYDGFKLRTRYRFKEKNELPIDTLLYLEYIRDDDFKAPNVLEGKIILAKDIGNFNFAYNQILKQELESGGKTEHEYAAGASYSVTPRFSLGVETKGNYTDSKFYLGPTVAWLASKFWVSAGLVAGLNNKSDDLQVRFIVGVPF